MRVRCEDRVLCCIGGLEDIYMWQASQVYVVSIAHVDPSKCVFFFLLVCMASPTPLNQNRVGNERARHFGFFRYRGAVRIQLSRFICTRASTRHNANGNCGCVFVRERESVCVCVSVIAGVCSGHATP